MASVAIKICGITTPEAIDAAIGARGLYRVQFLSRRARARSFAKRPNWPGARRAGSPRWVCSSMPRTR